MAEMSTRCREDPGIFGFCTDDLISALYLRLLGGVAIAGMHMPGLKMLPTAAPARLKRAEAAFILRVMPREMGSPF
jgi:hypothetical protein